MKMIRKCLVIIPCFFAFTLTLPTKIGLNNQQQFWNKLALDDLKNAIEMKLKINKAKNVILFMGDGMSISTLTAARILQGQKKGKTGEEGYLKFEKFAHMALLKTYTVDKQVADSAGSAIAYLTGVKGNSGTIGVDENVKYKNCSTYKPQYNTKSIVRHAIENGKAGGFVTTARVTHASVANVFAHSPYRSWEGDARRNREVPDIEERKQCPDIASQLVTEGLDLKVVLGGGRKYFNNKLDPEYSDKRGEREDKRDIIEEWECAQKNKGRMSRYVWNSSEFMKINPADDEYILGLFEPSHMHFEIERMRDKAGEPSLAEMTRKAIEILSRNTEGYFLFVEGGRIDHGHHDSIAKQALTDTLALDQAVKAATHITDIEDTLIMVTADHSHVFAISGYSTRGRPIFGLANERMSPDPVLAKDNKPYTILGYVNGPGASINGTRRDISKDNLTANNYVQQSLVPLDDETHGGEEVVVYAQGPMSHLFHRLHEQNYVAHVAMYSACVGPYAGKQCAFSSAEQSLNLSVYMLILTLVSFTLLHICLKI